jgi:putative transposase
MRGRSL